MAPYHLSVIHFSSQVILHGICRSRTDRCGVVELGVHESCGVPVSLSVQLSLDLRRLKLRFDRLGPAALAAQSVIMVVATIMYHIPYSVGVAAAVRTGNFLGSGNARQAYIAARAATGLALLGGVVLGYIH
jgi:hypothetical protein